jgi:hypothetical protein
MQSIPSTSSQEAPMPQSPTSPGTPIHIVIGATVITAELWDNAPPEHSSKRSP